MSPLATAHLVQRLEDLRLVLEADTDELGRSPTDAHLREALGRRARYAQALSRLLGDVLDAPGPRRGPAPRAAAGGRPSRPWGAIDLHRRRG